MSKLLFVCFGGFLSKDKLPKGFDDLLIVTLSLKEVQSVVLPCAASSRARGILSGK